ncbi:hypothetical protein COEREDRAFT_82837 [Coemansia reversa NRRL 1564]|uniref:rRNA-processing protein n=1 Tax=Coemansia reversa (strain ATCC 12441 / NRRL 1564) TaxID=763665 RepID=A0A2G5B5N7_COERN|nr:hypothetical protein COEREDRAFT_82837 [Coemansia reversa NRRL 1564]|eukprot:PIA14319.1 hypothetical protein COEREDRAFT_82837 [Coemansia reversa NRRL 1564]
MAGATEAQDGFKAATHQGTPLTRVSGRPWKQPKSAANRSMMSKTLRRTYQQRMEKHRDQLALKQTQQELHDEKEAEKTALREKLIERRRKREEKLQRELHESKMSERKRMRMKRKELRARAHAKH